MTKKKATKKTKAERTEAAKYAALARAEQCEICRVWFTAKEMIDHVSSGCTIGESNKQSPTDWDWAKNPEGPSSHMSIDSGEGVDEVGVENETVERYIKSCEHQLDLYKEELTQALTGDVNIRQVLSRTVWDLTATEEISNLARGIRKWFQNSDECETLLDGLLKVREGINEALIKGNYVEHSTNPLSNITLLAAGEGARRFLRDTARLGLDLTTSTDNNKEGK